MLWLKVLELTIKKSLDGRILNLTFPLLLSFYSFSSIYDREKQDKKAKKKTKIPWTKFICEYVWENEWLCEKLKIGNEI